MTDQPKLYSLQRLLEIDNADDGFVRDIVSVFLNNVPVNATELIKACSEKNWYTVYFTAHKMKANIDLLGINCLYNEIREVELMAKTETNLHQITDKINFIHNIIQRASNEMRSDLNL